MDEETFVKLLQENTNYNNILKKEGAGKLLQEHCEKNNIYIIQRVDKKESNSSLHRSYKEVNNFIQYNVNKNEDIYDRICYKEIFDMDNDGVILITIRTTWTWKKIGKIYGLSVEEYLELLEEGKLSGDK